MNKKYWNAGFNLGIDFSFLKRISCLSLLLLTAVIFAFGQSASNGDYRTRASGTWSGANTWQVRTAGAWSNTGIAPTSTANIYIQNNHTVTVDIATADCKDLNIHLGGAVTIGTRMLQVSGKLRAYTGTAVTSLVDGTFYSSQASSTSPVDGMINTTGAGLLKFIGATRGITFTGEWATNSTTHATEFALDAGATGTLQTGYKSSSINISSGTIDMGANRLSPDNNVTNQGDCIIQSGATLVSSNSGGTGFSVMSRTGTAATGRAGTFTLNGKLVLMGISPEIQFTTININAGSTIEYGAAVNQNFVTKTFTGAAAIGSSYSNLVLSGSGTKTPPGNFTVSKDISITGAAVLPLGAYTLTLGGNWTSYGTAGLTESTSTIDFNGTGAQVVNTTGGEDFFIVKKSAAGTLTLNSDVRLAGTSSELNISSGILDAGTNTLSGTASTAFTMSAGTLKLAKLNTVLPEFSISPAYNLSGGTIELNGAGTQTLRGNRDYRNLTFSNSGTKGISTTINTITGTISIANTAVLDVSNNTMGGANTNITMTGTSTYKTAGTLVKPDATGTYTLGSGTTMEFTNTALTLQSIRLTPATGNVVYYNIVVSGTAVGTTAASGIKFQPGGSFTVKNGAVFKLQNANGFSGTAVTSIDNTNNPAIVLEPGSAIEYNGADQTITNQAINTPSDAHYERLILGGTGFKTAPDNTLTIKGNLTKTGTTVFDHNSGTVVFNGTGTQAYNAADPVMAFYNFTNANTSDLSINNNLSVAGELAFADYSKLNLQSGKFTMLSDATGTAHVGKIPDSARISYFADGVFSIERYIPTGTGASPNHGKTWQFLATPTNGGQTINAAWQEGAGTPNANPASGYGTQITSNISPLPGMFDVYTYPGPSMKWYDPASNGWVGVPNTNSTPLYNQKGYMLFVRGDRSVTTYNGTATATILRSSGKIAHPVTNIPPLTYVGETLFESVGNPYASAIDFSNDAAVIKEGNLQKVFYVWDPKLGSGLGAYQTFTKGLDPDNNYYVSPGDGSYGNIGSINNIIQSGQAFFVHTFGGTGSLTFTEDAKVNSSSLVTRPVAPSGQRAKKLATQLFAVSGNNFVLTDAVVNQYDQSCSNSIDRLDAIKVQNVEENIGIVSHHQLLSVERRKDVGQADTIFYHMGQMKLREYALQFLPLGMAKPGLQAYLEDAFKHTQTAVSLNDTTVYRFSVTNDAASNAANRFRLVFQQKKVTGNGSNPVLANGMFVYPNPVTGKNVSLSVNGFTAGTYKLQLISQSAQVIYEGLLRINADQFQTSIPLKNASAGTYQLILVDDRGRKNAVTVMVN